MAFDIKVLRQRKADMVRKASAILEAAQTANRDITDAERTEYDGLMASVKTLSGDIERAETLMDAERSLLGSRSITVGVNHAEEKPWTSLCEQLQAVRRHANTKGVETDPRLYAAALGGNESVDSEGGFLVPPEFAPGVWQRTYDQSDLMSRCFDQPMTQSNRLLVNVQSTKTAALTEAGGAACNPSGSASREPTRPHSRNSARWS